MKYPQQLEDPVQPAALERAAAALALRHPALRTTVHDTPAGPVQRVAAAPPVEIPVEVRVEEAALAAFAHQGYPPASLE